MSSSVSRCNYCGDTLNNNNKHSFTICNNCKQVFHCSNGCATSDIQHMFSCEFSFQSSSQTKMPNVVVATTTREEDDEQKLLIKLTGAQVPRYVETNLTEEQFKKLRQWIRIRPTATADETKSSKTKELLVIYKSMVESPETLSGRFELETTLFKQFKTLFLETKEFQILKRPKPLIQKILVKESSSSAVGGIIDPNGNRMLSIITEEDYLLFKQTNEELIEIVMSSSYLHQNQQFHQIMEEDRDRRQKYLVFLREKFPINKVGLIVTIPQLIDYQLPIRIAGIDRKDITMIVNEKTESSTEKVRKGRFYKLDNVRLYYELLYQYVKRVATIYGLETATEIYLRNSCIDIPPTSLALRLIGKSPDVHQIISSIVQSPNNRISRWLNWHTTGSGKTVVFSRVLSNFFDSKYLIANASSLSKRINNFKNGEGDIEDLSYPRLIIVTKSKLKNTSSIKVNQGGKKQKKQSFVEAGKDLWAFLWNRNDILETFIRIKHNIDPREQSLNTKSFIQQKMIELKLHPEELIQAIQNYNILFLSYRQFVKIFTTYVDQKDLSSYSGDTNDAKSHGGGQNNYAPTCSKAIQRRLFPEGSFKAPYGIMRTLKPETGKYEPVGWTRLHYKPIESDINWLGSAKIVVDEAHNIFNPEELGLIQQDILYDLCIRYPTLIISYFSATPYYQNERNLLRLLTMSSADFYYQQHPALYEDLIIKGPVYNKIVDKNGFGQSVNSNKNTSPLLTTEEDNGAAIRLYNAIEMATLKEIDLKSYAKLKEPEEQVVSGESSSESKAIIAKVQNVLLGRLSYVDAYENYDKFPMLEEAPIYTVAPVRNLRRIKQALESETSASFGTSDDDLLMIASLFVNETTSTIKQRDDSSEDDEELDNSKSYEEANDKMNIDETSSNKTSTQPSLINDQSSTTTPIVREKRVRKKPEFFINQQVEKESLLITTTAKPSESIKKRKTTRIYDDDDEEDEEDEDMNNNQFDDSSVDDEGGDFAKNMNANRLIRKRTFQQFSSLGLIDHTFQEKSLLSNQYDVSKWYPKQLVVTSPSMEALLEKINEYDTVDAIKYGRPFKHAIYARDTDTLQIFASFLLAQGYGSVSYQSSIENRTPSELVLRKSPNKILSIKELKRGFIIDDDDDDSNDKSIVDKSKNLSEIRYEGTNYPVIGHYDKKDNRLLIPAFVTLSDTRAVDQNILDPNNQKLDTLINGRGSLKRNNSLVTDFYFGKVVDMREALKRYYCKDVLNWLNNNILKIHMSLAMEINREQVERTFSESSYKDSQLDTELVFSCDGNNIIRMKNATETQRKRILEYLQSKDLKSLYDSNEGTTTELLILFFDQFEGLIDDDDDDDDNKRTTLSIRRLFGSMLNLILYVYYRRIIEQQIIKEPLMKSLQYLTPIMTQLSQKMSEKKSSSSSSILIYYKQSIEDLIGNDQYQRLLFHEEQLFKTIKNYDEITAYEPSPELKNLVDSMGQKIIRYYLPLFSSELSDLDSIKEALSKNSVFSISKEKYKPEGFNNDFGNRSESDKSHEEDDDVIELDYEEEFNDLLNEEVKSNVESNKSSLTSQSGPPKPKQKSTTNTTKIVDTKVRITRSTTKQLKEIQSLAKQSKSKKINEKVLVDTIKNVVKKKRGRPSKDEEMILIEEENKKIDSKLEEDQQQTNLTTYLSTLANKAVILIKSEFSSSQKIDLKSVKLYVNRFNQNNEGDRELSIEQVEPKNFGLDSILSQDSSLNFFDLLLDIGIIEYAPRFKNSDIANVSIKNVYSGLEALPNDEERRKLQRITSFDVEANDVITTGVSQMETKLTTQRKQLLENISSIQLELVSKDFKQPSLIKDQLNNNNNNIKLRGNIRFILFDSKYNEGIDLPDTKYIHMLEEPETEDINAQIRGRVGRRCSHKLLPREEGFWKVKIGIVNVQNDIQLPKWALEEPFLIDIRYVEDYMRSQAFHEFVDSVALDCVEKVRNDSRYGALVAYSRFVKSLYIPFHEEIKRKYIGDLLKKCSIEKNIARQISQGFVKCFLSGLVIHSNLNEQVKVFFANLRLYNKDEVSPTTTQSSSSSSPNNDKTNLFYIYRNGAKKFAGVNSKKEIGQGEYFVGFQYDNSSSNAYKPLDHINGVLLLDELELNSTIYVAPLAELFTDITQVSDNSAYIRKLWDKLYIDILPYSVQLLSFAPSEEYIQLESWRIFNALSVLKSILPKQSILFEDLMERLDVVLDLVRHPKNIFDNFQTIITKIQEDLGNKEVNTSNFLTKVLSTYQTDVQQQCRIYNLENFLRLAYVFIDPTIENFLDVKNTLIIDIFRSLEGLLGNYNRDYLFQFDSSKSYKEGCLILSQHDQENLFSASKDFTALQSFLFTQRGDRKNSTLTLVLLKLLSRLGFDVNQLLSAINGRKDTIEAIIEFVRADQNISQSLQRIHSTTQKVVRKQQIELLNTSLVVSRLFKDDQSSTLVKDLGKLYRNFINYVKTLTSISMLCTPDGGINMEIVDLYLLRLLLKPFISLSVLNIEESLGGGNKLRTILDKMKKEETTIKTVMDILRIPDLFTVNEVPLLDVISQAGLLFSGNRNNQFVSKLLSLTGNLDLLKSIDISKRIIRFANIELLSKDKSVVESAGFLVILGKYELNATKKVQILRLKMDVDENTMELRVPKLEMYANIEDSWDARFDFEVSIIQLWKEGLVRFTNPFEENIIIESIQHNLQNGDRRHSKLGQSHRSLILYNIILKPSFIELKIVAKDGQQQQQQQYLKFESNCRNFKEFNFAEFLLISSSSQLTSFIQHILLNIVTSSSSPTNEGSLLQISLYTLTDVLLISVNSNGRDQNLKIIEKLSIFIKDKLLQRPKQSIEIARKSWIIYHHFTLFLISLGPKLSRNECELIQRLYLFVTPFLNELSKIKQQQSISYQTYIKLITESFQDLLKNQMLDDIKREIATAAPNRTLLHMWVSLLKTCDNIFEFVTISSDCSSGEVTLFVVRLKKFQQETENEWKIIQQDKKASKKIDSTTQQPSQLPTELQNITTTESSNDSHTIPLVSESPTTGYKSSIPINDNDEETISFKSIEPVININTINNNNDIVIDDDDDNTILSKKIYSGSTITTTLPNIDILITKKRPFHHIDVTTTTTSTKKPGVIDLTLEDDEDIIVIPHKKKRRIEEIVQPFKQQQ